MLGRNVKRASPVAGIAGCRHEGSRDVLGKGPSVIGIEVAEEGDRLRLTATTAGPAARSR